MLRNTDEPLMQCFEQLVTDFDIDEGIVWCFMKPYPRPCFTPQLLNDLNRFLNLIKNKVKSDYNSRGSSDIKYLIFGSYQPGIFSLGGDLSLFTECIKNSAKERLTEYMRLSIEVMYSIYSNLDVPLTTIALVRGNALGAGFEGALSCDYIIAEKSVQLGFPEVLFNMFPGMGAYSFLARRLDQVRVESMILNGRIYSCEELSEMGLIDVVAEDGRGLEETIRFIKKNQKSHTTRRAVLKIRHLTNPVTYEEMLEIGGMWVDCAMSLSQREIKTMGRLVRSQDRIAKSLVQNAETGPKALETGA